MHSAYRNKTCLLFRMPIAVSRDASLNCALNDDGGDLHQILATEASRCSKREVLGGGGGEGRDSSGS